MPRADIATVGAQGCFNSTDYISSLSTILVGNRCGDKRRRLDSDEDLSDSSSCSYLTPSHSTRQCRGIVLGYAARNLALSNKVLIGKQQSGGQAGPIVCASENKNREKDRTE